MQFTETIFCTTFVGNHSKIIPSEIVAGPQIRIPTFAGQPGERAEPDPWFARYGS